MRARGWRCQVLWVFFFQACGERDEKGVVSCFNRNHIFFFFNTKWKVCWNMSLTYASCFLHCLPWNSLILLFLTIECHWGHLKRSWRCDRLLALWEQSVNFVSCFLTGLIKENTNAMEICVKVREHVHL